jgi:hypothetical protein
MQIPSGEGEEMVNSLLVTQVNCNSPSHGLAVVVKKRIPTTWGSASRGWNLFFTTPAKPWLGELKLPFVTRRKFIIPTTRGFATCGRNYTIPSPPPEGITSMQLHVFLNTLSISHSLGRRQIKPISLQWFVVTHSMVVVTTESQYIGYLIDGPP